jgi:hypothetical protein
MMPESEPRPYAPTSFMSSIAALVRAAAESRVAPAWMRGFRRVGPAFENDAATG